MLLHHPDVVLTIAAEHADRLRAVAAAAAETSAATPIRRRLGSLLIAAGERLAPRTEAPTLPGASADPCR